MADLTGIVQARLAFLEEMGRIPDEREQRIAGERLCDWFAPRLDDGRVRFWFAEEDGVWLASGGALRQEFAPLDALGPCDRAYLFSIYTRPAYRRLGHATRVVRAILDALAADPCLARVWLLATESGGRVYENCGFRLQPEAMEYFLPGRDGRECDIAAARGE